MNIASVFRTAAVAALTIVLTAGAVLAGEEGSDDGGDKRRDALPFADADEDAAVVIGWVGRPARYIYPVEFIAIDGKNIYPREVMRLVPGEYELTVRGFVRNPPGLQSRGRFRQPDGYNRIEVVVEAGKAYSIGMKYPDDPAGPINTVVYRVEDT